MDTCLPNTRSSKTLVLSAGLIYWTLRALSPSTFSVCFILSFLSHTHIYTQTTIILKTHRERKREMVPVIFSLLTGALQRSMSQIPQGEDIKQRKNLSHFIVFYHRELISLFSLSYSVFTLFLHFSHIPSIHLLCPLLGLCTSFSISIFYKV